VNKQRLDDIRTLLDRYYRKYARPAFIQSDPVQIPHRFTKKEDVEIAAFLTATISWGNRKSILANCHKLMSLMDNEPHAFVVSHSAGDLKRFRGFVHRTFNATDCTFFIESLKNIYRTGGLEMCFGKKDDDQDLKARIMRFRDIFFSIGHPERTLKHVSDPGKKSSAKRLCMFLRWMVRSPKEGIDFGIWKNISPAHLKIPLDVHSANAARAIGILKRKQNDWVAVEELTAFLSLLDPEDPVKYDLALFNLDLFPS
jgi:uncharacterized protein (TIGR02757 family)